MRQTPASPNLDDDKPLTNFSSCHEGIVSHLKTFGELPALLASAARARQIAEETLAFFQGAVFDHHAEEERDLFPAVLAHAARGGEHGKVQELIKGLTAEHREIEAIWAKLEPQLQKVAKGHLADVDAASVRQLVDKYSAHAKLEEDEFLPLAEQILGRNSADLAALGLALHTRHVVRAWRRGLRGS